MHLSATKALAYTYTWEGNRSLRISRGVLRSFGSSCGTRRGAQVAGNEAKVVGRRQKEATIEKRGRIYGGKSQPSACNYRSDRYTNGWIITVGARCCARPRRRARAPREENWHSELRGVINVSFASGINRSALLAVYSAAYIRKIRRAPTLDSETIRGRCDDTWKRVHP